MKKKLLSIVLSSAIAMSAVSTVVAAQVPVSMDLYFAPIEFTFDGVQLAPPEGQEGFIFEGTTYVPLRFVSYALNKAVRWDGGTYTVTVEEPAVEDLKEIHEYRTQTTVANAVKREEFDTKLLVPKKVSVYQEQVKYVFDGEEKVIASGISGLIIDNRLYVPLRFVAESVGREMKWDPVAYAIAADKKAPVDPIVTTEEEQKPVATTPESTGAGNSGSTSGTGTAPSQGNSNPAPGGGNPVQPGPQQPEQPKIDPALRAAVESKLSALESRCNSELNSLISEFKQLSFSEQLARGAEYMERAGTVEARCDSDFSTIMSDVTKDGYEDPAAARKEYEDQYEARKQARYNELVGYN